MTTGTRPVTLIRTPSAPQREPYRRAAPNLRNEIRKHPDAPAGRRCHRRGSGHATKTRSRTNAGKEAR